MMGGKLRGHVLVITLGCQEVQAVCKALHLCLSVQLAAGQLIFYVTCG